MKKETPKTGPGYLVETSLGKGRTYHKDGLINDKLPVYLEDGRKILCTVQKLKLIGYVD